MGLIFNDSNHNPTFCFNQTKKNNNKKKHSKKLYKYKKQITKSVSSHHQLIPLTRESCVSLQSLGYKIK